jgi:hypothetical protein
LSPLRAGLFAAVAYYRSLACLALYALLVALAA